MSFLLKPKTQSKAPYRPRLTREMVEGQIKQGHTFPGAGNPGGISLLTRIRETLKMRSRKTDAPETQTRMDDAADAYVKMMEQGSFVHLKEVIDRDEGKVPDRVADAQGKNIKIYIGMPVDGDAGAP